MDGIESSWQLEGVQNGSFQLKLSAAMNQACLCAECAMTSCAAALDAVLAVCSYPALPCKQDGVRLSDVRGLQELSWQRWESFSVIWGVWCMWGMRCMLPAVVQGL